MKSIKLSNSTVVEKTNQFALYCIKITNPELRVLGNKLIIIDDSNYLVDKKAGKFILEFYLHVTRRRLMGRLLAKIWEILV